MFFNKSTRKRRNPYVTMTLVGLAVIGAASTVNAGKRFIKDKMHCIMGFFKCASKSDCTDVQKSCECKSNS